MVLMTSCQSHYVVSGISGSRILVDSRYDAVKDVEAEAYMAPFKARVDSIMEPKVGTAARYLASHRPESELSNLMADMLVWVGGKYDEKPDFAVYNMGGIRAALPSGKVTYGDVMEVAPFENRICFLSLTGAKVMELFGQIARRGGEAVSRGVELVIDGKGELKSARLNGQDIDLEATYRVATIDYVAAGNDKMEAFKSKTDVKAPNDERSIARLVLVDYLKEQERMGKAVDGNIEGRIKVED